MKAEQLIVVKNNTVPPLHGASSTSLLEMLAAAEITVQPRTPELELDASWLQLVAYVVVHGVRDGVRCVLRYRRGGGEEEHRLAGKFSIGVGGHITAADCRSSALTPGSAVGACVEGAVRELKEELPGCLSKGRSPLLRGIVRSLTDAVGQVHLGCVLSLDVGEIADGMLAGATLGSPEWVPLDALAAEAGLLEVWSALLLPWVSFKDWSVEEPRIQRRLRLWQSVSVSPNQFIPETPAAWYAPERDIITVAPAAVEAALCSLEEAEQQQLRPLLEGAMAWTVAYNGEQQWSEAVARLDKMPVFHQFLQELGGIVFVTAAQVKQLLATAETGV